MYGTTQPPSAFSTKTSYKRRRQPAVGDVTERPANIDGPQDAKRLNLRSTLHLRPRPAVDQT
jgi:hypothetical protein